MLKLLVILWAVLRCSNLAFALEQEIFKVGECYVLRLVNGDLFEGEVLSFVSDIEGDGIKFESEIGTGVIYYSQIIDARECSKYYRGSHKYFLMPTAIGIGNNHFLGMLELFFLYAGFGVKDYFSFLAGRSLLPFAYSNQQISLINVKGSLPRMKFEEILKEFQIAIGGNLGFANSNNKFIHIYGVATSSFYKTTLSVALFYKSGSMDLYTFRYGINTVDFTYPDGSFGISFGLDTRLPQYKDVHVIGEIWNIDIARPTNSALFLGVRLCNSNFITDFGLSFFTQPFVLPIINFQWMPF